MLWAFRGRDPGTLVAAWDRFWFLQFAVRSHVLVASGDTPDGLVEVAFLMPAFLCFLENSKVCPHLSRSPNAFSSFLLHACDLKLPKDTTAGPGHSRAFSKFSYCLLGRSAAGSRRVSPSCPISQRCQLAGVTLGLDASVSCSASCFPPGVAVGKCTKPWTLSLALSK